MNNKQAFTYYSPFKKLAILLLLLYLAGWIPYSYFTAPPPRFCDEKNRVLANEEFIIAALESLYKYNAIKIDVSTKTPQDFYKRYPNCCKVGNRPPMMKRNIWGDLYDKNQGHVMMTIFYPTSEKRLANLIKVYGESQSESHIKFIDDKLTYTKTSFQISDCGGIGKSTDEFLTIKDTPFANNIE